MLIQSVRHDWPERSGVLIRRALILGSTPGLISKVLSCVCCYHKGPELSGLLYLGLYDYRSHTSGVYSEMVQRGTQSVQRRLLLFSGDCREYHSEY